MDDFDRRWKRIHEQLLAQARGDEAPRVASRRTLFGIKSGVETQMDMFAQQIERERAERVRARKQREREGRFMDTHDSYILDVEAVVELEHMIAADGTPLAALMRNAGTALARAVREHVEQTGAKRRVAVLVGSGNNGGDGWVAAELLEAGGYDVALVAPRAATELAAEPARSAALDALRAAPGMRVLVAPDADALAEELAGASVAIDAMLGTGFAHETLREPYAGWTRALCAAREHDGTYVIAADVASGVSAQTGAAAQPHVTADETVTMMVLKPGLLAGAGASACGTLRVADICELGPYTGYLAEHDLRGHA